MQMIGENLLEAETILERLSKAMAEEAKENMSSWPRDWMAKHVQDRELLLRTRDMLLRRIEESK